MLTAISSSPAIADRQQNSAPSLWPSSSRLNPSRSIPWLYHTLAARVRLQATPLGFEVRQLTISIRIGMRRPRQVQTAGNIIEKEWNGTAIQSL
jgi:hypothetical protein